MVAFTLSNKLLRISSVYKLFFASEKCSILQPKGPGALANLQSLQSDSFHSLFETEAACKRENVCMVHQAVDQRRREFGVPKDGGPLAKFQVRHHFAFHNNP